MLEGKIDHVIGVDTHRDHHAAAILDRNGGLIAQLEVPTNQAGYARLLGLVAERAPGRRCCARTPRPRRWRRSCARWSRRWRRCC
jgi:hypothetical protein